MRLNLGCGPDLRAGYLNVDIVGMRVPTGIDFVVHDLDPDTGWPWPDGSVDEVLMLDFLEHFPYRKTKKILMEVWRVLVVDGFVEIQVPDFDHCSRAVLCHGPYMCNVCGGPMVDYGDCGGCGRTWQLVAEAALHRLYGGQDRPGNWHNMAFSRQFLQGYLEDCGFHNFTWPEEAHQWQNWNFKCRAQKRATFW